MRTFPSIRRMTLIAIYSAVLLACVAATGAVGYGTFRRIARTVAAHRIPEYGDVPIVFFFLHGCPGCAAATPAIAQLERRYPHQLVRIDAATARGSALQDEYTAAYQVTKDDQSRVPVVFTGEHYFLGPAEIQKALPAYLKEATVDGQLPPPRPAPTAAVANAAPAAGR